MMITLFDFIKDIFVTFLNRLLNTKHSKIVMIDACSWAGTSRWSPETAHFFDGTEWAEGISVSTTISLELSNEGKLDSGIERIYLVIYIGKDGQFPLTPISFDAKKVVIQPRRSLNLSKIEFSAFIDNVHSLPSTVDADIFVKPVAHKPIKKRLKLVFDI